MVKIITVFLVSVTVVIFLFAVYLYLGERGVVEKISIFSGNEEPEDFGESGDLDNKIGGESSVVEAGTGGIAGGVEGTNENSLIDSNESSEDEEELPSDLYDVECGFYFKGYEICAGTCPLGECVSEGRSCYCRV